MSVFGRVQMTNEIGLAFSHPIERSVASGISVDDQDVDRISLRDHIVEVEIGAFQAGVERPREFVSTWWSRCVRSFRRRSMMSIVS